MRDANICGKIVKRVTSLDMMSSVIQRETEWNSGDALVELQMFF